MKKAAIEVMLWGSIWGLFEATAGYILHRGAVALPGLPGFLMFPFALFFMNMAVKSTGSPASAIKAALLAAAIKLIDFLVPGHDPIRIVNPALSLLMEGLVTYLAAISFSRGIFPMGFRHCFIVSATWRSLFFVYLWITSFFGLPAGLVTGGMAISLRFLLLESLVNASVISALVRLPRPRAMVFPHLETTALYAAGTLVAATVAQYLL